MSRNITVKQTPQRTIIIEPQGREIALKKLERKILLTNKGINGINGTDGAGFTPTQEEFLIIAGSKLAPIDDAQTVLNGNDQPTSFVYTDWQGYESQSLVMTYNGDDQLATARRTFTYGGEVWVYDISLIYNSDGVFTGKPITEFSRT